MPLAAAGISAGTSLIGGLIGSNAAHKAAQQQQQGYLNAQNYAQDTKNEGLGDINSNLTKQLGYTQPYTSAGSQAVGTLSDLTKTPGQGLLQGWNQSFQAPTAEQARQTPGYEFAREQADKGIQASAAARGGLLSGGTAKALSQYNQGLADTNYQQVYNNAFQNYLQNYGQFQQNQSNQYNRLMGQAGLGQWGAGTAVNALGQATGQQLGVLSDASHQIGQDMTGGAAAQASGTVGAANAWTGALGGIGNAASSYSLLSSLNGRGGGSAGPADWGAANTATGGYYNPSAPFNQTGYGTGG